MKKISVFVLLLCGLLLFSCKKQSGPGDFFKTVAGDKDYSRRLTLGEFELSCVYRPAELICLSELSGGNAHFKYNKALFEKEMKNYENGCYIDFTLRLQSRENLVLRGVADEKEYADRLGQLTYLFSRDCYMIADGKDTIKPMNCTFTNTYGNSPDVNIMLVFSKKKIMHAQDELLFVYNDKTFGLPEKAVFTYSADDIKKEVPTLTE